MQKFQPKSRGPTESQGRRTQWWSSPSVEVAGNVSCYLRVLATPADCNTAALTPTVRHAEYEMPFRSP